MYTAHWPLIGLTAIGVMSGCGMHHESKGALLRQANVSLIDAVRTAENNVTGGKAVEAELERENGRPVYEVDMIDSAHKARKVHVDAATGKITKID